MNLDNEDFHTRDFLFEDGTLFLFRRRYIDKKILYEQIESVEFRKGSPLKRPGLAIAFGVALLLFNLWIFVSSGFDLYIFFSTGLFFIAGVGLYAIYSGLPVQPVIAVRFNNEVECFSVSTFIKAKTIEYFVSFLRKELGDEKITVGDLT